ncbi:MAG: hypothetical protein EOO46_14610, partial [Flavobacterium sp.]
MKGKRILFFAIAVSNILFLFSLYYIYYYKEASFDTLKVPQINSSIINSIETDEGTWIWNSQEYDFYTDYKVKLTDRKEIQEFFTIIKRSKAKYIDNLRCKNWINIYFEFDNKLVHT